jgi:hypothetical protein
MEPAPLKCRRPAFSGTYNIVDDSEDLEKYAKFVSILCGDGAQFYPDNSRGGTGFLSSPQEIAKVFIRAVSDNWVGRLVVPPDVVNRCLEKTVKDADKNTDWGRQARAWMEVARDYPRLTVTLEFPGRAEMATVIITYWTYDPPLYGQVPHAVAAEPEEIPADSAASILVDDLYVAIDNLFSAFVFTAGDFGYPQNELRKLSFTYLLELSGAANLLDTKFDTLRDLFRRTLLISLPESVSATRIGDEAVLVYSSGFVGMTGQPDLGKTPGLQLLFWDLAGGSSEQAVLESLRALAVIEKTAAYLNTIAEAYLPSVRDALRDERQEVRAIAGRAQQLLVDVAAARDINEITTLVDREIILSQELAGTVSRHYELRDYLSRFLGSALRAMLSIRSAKSEAFLRLAFGSRLVTEPYERRADELAANLVQAESDLVRVFEELHNLQVSAAGTRSDLRNRYLGIASEDAAKLESVIETCFVLMAFRPELDEIYREIILPLFSEASLNLRCYRADEIFGTAPVMQDVWAAITKARIVIAELTGRNPNVLYELGLTHVLRKPAILIVQSMDDVPFDLRHLRCIVYSLGPGGLRKLRTDLEATIRQVLSSPSREVVLFGGQ